MIALVGDTHLPRGSRRLPARLVELVREASLVLHVGDVVTAGALAELRLLGTPVVAVHGNMDEPELQAELPARLAVEAEGLRFGLVHSGGPRTGRHARLRAAFPDCDVVCYGHSHQPEIACSDGVWILNPGSPTERRRAPTRTMIVVRHREPELVDLGAR